MKLLLKTKYIQLFVIAFAILLLGETPLLASGHPATRICPTFYITGQTSVCAGGYAVLRVVLTSYTSYPWTYSWSNGSTLDASVYGPIWTNTNACVTVGGSPGGIWCSVTQCVVIQPIFVSDAYRDTTSCVNTNLSLYWPFTGTPNYWQTFNFTSPGNYTNYCRNNPDPCNHNECWNIRVCPQPDFSIVGDTLVCSGANAILRAVPTPATLEAYSDGRVQWSTGHTTYSITIGPITRDTTVCATISGNCGGNWCNSATKCIRVHPMTISTVTKDTFGCVDSTISLYWPISSTARLIWSDYRYTSPGRYQVCEHYYHPCEYTECWNIDICPRPSDHFTIAVFDTLVNGEINYRVCLWSNDDPPQPRTHAFWRTGIIDTFNANCRIVRAPCHGDKQVCVIDDSLCVGTETCTTELCTTVVGNYTCPCISEIIDSPAVAEICPGDCKKLCLVSNPSFSHLNLVEWYGRGELVGNDSCVVVCPETTTTYNVYGYLDLPQGCFAFKTVQVTTPARTLRDTSICLNQTLTLTIPALPGDSIFIIDSLTNDTLDFLKPIQARNVTTTITPRTSGIHRICKDLKREGCHFTECMNLNVQVPPSDVINIIPPLCPTDTVVQVCLDNTHRYIRWSNGATSRCTNFYVRSERSSCGGLNGRGTKEIAVTIGDTYYDGTTCYATIIDTIELPVVKFKIIPNHISTLRRSSVLLTPVIEPYYATERLNWYTCPRGSWSSASTYPEPVPTPLSIERTTTFCASAVSLDGTCSVEACTTVYYGDHILTIIKTPFSGDSLSFFSIHDILGRADTAKGVSYVDWATGEYDVFVTVSKYEESPAGYYRFLNWNYNPTDTVPEKNYNCGAYACTLKAVYTGPLTSTLTVTVTSGDTLILPNIYPVDTILIGANYMTVTNNGLLPLVIGLRCFSFNVAGDICHTMRMADNYADYISSSQNVLGVEALFNNTPSNFDLTIYRTWVSGSLRWVNLGVNPSSSIYSAFKVYTPKDFDICYREMPRPLRATIGLMIYYRAGLP